MALGVQIKTGGKHLAYDRDVGDFLLPVTDGLMGQWFIGGDEAFAVKNRWARGGYGDGTAYGAPVYSAYHASFVSGTSGIILPFSDPVEGSIFAVIRNTDTLEDSDHLPNFIGTSPSSGSGANIYSYTNGIRANAYYAGGQYQRDDSLATSPAGINGWHAFCWKFGSSSVTLHNLTEDQSNTASPALGARAPSTQMLAIGARPGTSTTGTFDMAYAGVFNRQLSSDEDVAIYNKLKLMMADRGIAI